MARFTFKLPDIGEGIAEAEIVAWHVKLGDRVEEDQNIADMMTDKATVEMESPVAGTIVELAGEVGDQIPIGSALVVIETEGEEEVSPATEEPVLEAENPGVEEAQGADTTPAAVTNGDTASPVRAEPVEAQAASASPAAASLSTGSGRTDEGTTASPVRAEPVEAHAAGAAPAAASPSTGSGRTDEGTLAAPAGPPPAAHTLASPAVRARARDLGIDLSHIRPAEGERIRHADLDAYLRYNSGQGYAAAPARARADEQVRVIGMRRRIAENMAAAKRAIPHFTYVDEIDVTALEAMRGDLNANRGNRPKLTLLPFLIVAMCRTLPDFPMLNARYDDEAGVVTRSGRVHCGMATQTDAGLTVPVIHDAQDRNVWQLAAEITRLAEAARAQKLSPQELGGGTITVTSLGPLGGIATTPVINRPEVAIIGPNKIVERPVFRPDGRGGDEIVRAKLMNLSISCDHRVVDGWDAASYVQALRKYLETPVLLFAD